MSNVRMDHAQMLELKRWNTPTVYNGWERVTRRNAARERFNMEETRDFMPAMGPMVGRAVTVVIEPGNAEHRKTNPDAWLKYRRYVASVKGPKIVIVQDMNKPTIYGSFWGEVNANAHRGLGCVGAITDGAARDVDEMTNAGFKVIARRMCVGHAHSWPLRWNAEVEVFGTTVRPGELIHADKHGFLVIPEEDEEALLEATRFMDSNECRSVIAAARGDAGKDSAAYLEALADASRRFGKAALDRFGTEGEW